MIGVENFRFDDADVADVNEWKELTTNILKGAIAREKVNQEVDKLANSIRSKLEGRDKPSYVEVDENEKVVVPKFIANYLRRAKTDIGLMRVFEIANTKNELGKWKKEYDWIRKNSEKFAKAWIDGYTIEPEQPALLFTNQL